MLPFVISDLLMFFTFVLNLVSLPVMKCAIAYKYNWLVVVKTSLVEKGRKKNRTKKYLFQGFT